jgi:hypothetical protein
MGQKEGKSMKHPKKTLEEYYGLKPLEELKKLPTPRLLAYFKVERQKNYGAGFICGCCGEYVWNIHNGCEYMEALYKDWEVRLEAIKNELNTREHVPVRAVKPKKIFTGGRKKRFRRQDIARVRKQNSELSIAAAKEEMRAYIRNLYGTTK